MPVAAPLDWDELDSIDTAVNWTIADARELVERASGKRLKGWGFAAQSLPAF